MPHGVLSYRIGFEMKLIKENHNYLLNFLLFVSII